MLRFASSSKFSPSLPLLVKFKINNSEPFTNQQKFNVTIWFLQFAKHPLPLPNYLKNYMPILLMYNTK